MKKTAVKALIIFIIFFTGASCLLYLDSMCAETTGEGGKLVLNIEN
ncbi:MAG TPA: hypothetical protein IAC50_03830 [Candidatus Copromorpha excrementigallinarum]|uniref:Uncharacterized protein n=1 Tax=Candidatus Allocopromorpha excrementigallinarum TaxID=2840742 RepID=A0A9D1HZR0_9FIRM|nr:hypothetical protein [Candidatus Copromorpha excrementigallinarum]